MRQAAAMAALFCKGVCLGSDAKMVTTSCRMPLICAVFQRITVCNGSEAGLMSLHYNYI